MKVAIAFFVCFTVSFAAFAVIDRRDSMEYIDELELENMALRTSLNNLNNSLLACDDELFNRRDYYELVADFNSAIKKLGELELSRVVTKCDLYDSLGEIYNAPVPNGLYWHGTDFYCVWAESRTLSQQKETEYHEYCHYLVDKDFNHFCTDDDVVIIKR